MHEKNGHFVGLSFPDIAIYKYLKLYGHFFFGKLYCFIQTLKRYLSVIFSTSEAG